MDNRIVLITGANSGIGKAAALQFAKAGLTVLMACRNKKSGQQALTEIQQQSANTRVELFEVDMSSQRSIRECCKELKKRYDKLDILIHNAAYFNHGEGHRLSEDGIELTFATNTVGPFYMTTLLKELLSRSSDARILHASSTIIKHFFNPQRTIQWENVIGPYKGEKPYSVYQHYCDSKMALVMLTFLLAEQLKADNISVNALQINGARMSKETLKKFKPAWRVAAIIQNLYFPPPEKMADCYFTLCTANEFKGVTGKLFNHQIKEIEPAPANPSKIEEIKQLTTSKFHPRYAAERENQEEFLKRSRSLSSKSV
ncbi:SDR family NAD(P)-dependent oxidoreductase [Alkalihalophilus sp. As8PL]|uniref:SDR family NAD(P)-dependent oxidoreductase n=1 Tax=Alkalihalophilus sp. As8PL TaxID=3237103 RepID=A0AB39BV88_9BACI